MRPPTNMRQRSVMRCRTFFAVRSIAPLQQAAQDTDGMDHAVVLLSPASASYDQYPNFEVRGNHFRELVKALPGFAPATGA